MNKIPSYFLIVVAGLILSACQPSRQVDTQSQDTPPALRSIIVMPVDTVAAGPQAERTEQLQLEEGSRMMTQLLDEYFSQNKMNNIRFLDQSQIEATLADRTGSRQALARKVAIQLDSDAVLVFTLRRYIEREGANYSVVRPASVAFDYRLLSARTNDTLCTGSFDEEQKSLLENILSFNLKRGVRWQTVADYARDALAQKLSTCSSLSPK